jgi:hypothetical protein
VGLDTDSVTIELNYKPPPGVQWMIAGGEKSLHILMTRDEVFYIKCEDRKNSLVFLMKYQW